MTSINIPIDEQTSTLKENIKKDKSLKMFLTSNETSQSLKQNTIIKWRNYYDNLLNRLITRKQRRNETINRFFLF